MFHLQNYDSINIAIIKPNRLKQIQKTYSWQMHALGIEKEILFVRHEQKDCIG